MTKKLLLTLLLSISITCLTQAASVVIVENSGGTWSSETVLTGNYSAVCKNLWTKNFMAVGAVGANGIWWSNSGNSWKTTTAGSNSYGAVAWNSYTYDEFVAVKTGGGADFLGFSSSSATGLTGSYAKICKNETTGLSSQASNQYFALTPTGAIDMIDRNNAPAWNASQVTAGGGYTAIVSNNYVDQVYAINSGGLDLIYYDNGDWDTYHVYDNAFSLIAQDDREIDMAYLANANGLFMTTWNHDDGYVLTQINDHVYTALGAVGGDTVGVFGALASGGIEKIYQDGENIITEVVLGSGNYSALDGDYEDPNVLVAIEVPEPATMSLLVLGGLGVIIRRRK